MITDWLVAVGTLLLAFVAIFQDKIRSWRIRPKLDISIETEPPDCLKIPIVKYSSEGEQSVSADSYYIRFKVVNRGNQRAEAVEVFATKLLRQKADDSFTEEQSFLPMNLLWSDYRTTFIPAISPGMYRHCDLCHIIHPEKRAQFTAEHKAWPNISQEKTILSFDTAVKPHTLSHLQPFGKYQLEILVAAANVKPVKRTLEISLKGEWYDNEQDMLSQGVGIRVK